MTTGATFVDFTEKRLLGRQDLDDRLLDYVQGLIRESFEKSYRTGVVFDTILGLSADGADKFQITGTSDAADGLGHLLDLDGFGYKGAIQFQNTNTAIYYVALHYCEVPDGVQVNPRTGLPEYIGAQEFIGEVADPDAVIDNGNGTITFQVDSVTEATVSNAGRQVRVWKKSPAKNATTPAIAIEELTVVWTGQNRVTTTGDLGQDSISVTAADYSVALLGPTVKRYTNLIGVDGYAFVGKVTGAGAGNPPTTFDTTDQDVTTASLSDLQDITSRNATTDRLKIDVKSYTGDVADPQIAVRDPGGSVVFSVDGNGNVVIQGETTQYDFVEVNASETITDNLTAGDAATDSHLITGTWTHQPAGGGTSYFEINGSTGRIGIGQAPPASGVLGITGGVAITGGDLTTRNILPEAASTYNVGSPSLPWLNFYVDNLNSGNIYPLADNTYDIGSGALRWQDGHFVMGRFNQAKVGNNPLGSLPSSVELFWVRGEHAIFPNSTIASAAVTSSMTSPGTALDSYAQALDVYMSLGSPGIGTGAASKVDGLQATVKVGGDNYLATGVSVKTDTWSSPTVTHLAGYHVQSTALAYAGVTNRYGLWVENVYGGTNNYAIKTEGASALVSFAGPTIPGSDAAVTLGRTTERWNEGHFAWWLSVGSPTSPPGGQLLNVASNWGSGDTSTTTALIHDQCNKVNGVTTNRASLWVKTELLSTIYAEQNVKGIIADHICTNAGTNTGNAWGFQSRGEVASGVSTTSLGHFHARNVTGSGSMTNQYGLYVTDLTFATNNYAIYVEGAQDSLFGGGDIRPITDGTGELGSSSYRWNYVHTRRLRVGYGGPTTGEYLMTVRNPTENTDLLSAASYGVIMYPYWDNASSTGTRVGFLTSAQVEDHSSGYAFTGYQFWAASNGTATTWTNSQAGVSVSMDNKSTNDSCPDGYIVRINTPTVTGSNTPWTNLRGVYINDLGGAGTSTNNALEIADQTAGYAIYGGAGLYRFAGTTYITGTIFASSSIRSSLHYPNADHTYDLGTSTYRWDTVYAHNFNGDLANTSESFFYRTTTSGFVATFRCDGGAAASEGIRIWAGEDTPISSTDFIYCYDGNGTAVGHIFNSAGVFQLGDLSDPRAKTRADGTPADKVGLEETKLSGLDIVNRLRLVEFRFKRRKGRDELAADDPNPFHDEAEPNGRFFPIGFDARNCAEVFPQMASKTLARAKDKETGFGEELWTTSKAELIPVLTKAIQEQQAEIESLKKRLDKMAA